MSRDIKGYQGGYLRNLKGILGALLMRVWLISVFKLVSIKKNLKRKLTA